MNSIRTLSRREKWKSILKIAWPLIIANSFWNLQLTIDRVYLGHFSTEALGASMAVTSIFWAPMALLQQTAGYLMTFVAQYFGAKELRMIGPAVWQGIYVSLIGGLLFLLLIPLTPTLFQWVGHSSTMQDLEIKYFVTVCYSALPMALIAVASGFFTGLGNTKMVIWINLVGLVFNAVLDYPMIFGKWGFPEMGIEGAGYATAIANWASAIFGLCLVLRQKHEAVYAMLSGWKFHLDLMKRYLRFGIPSGLQWSLEGLAFTVFMIIIGRMPNGDVALSSSSVAVTIMMLSVLPAMGVAQAASILVGQYLGNKEPDQAESSTWSAVQVALIYICIASISFVLIPDFYISWFKNNENAALWGDVQMMARYLLMFVAFFTLFDSMNLVFSFALKGAGDTKFVSLVALVLPWPIMVLPTWFMKDWPGAVYWAWGVASLFGVCQAMVFWRRFVGGKWKSMSVIH